jgi:hypothetical protein
MDWIKIKIEHISPEFSNAQVGALIRFQIFIARYGRYPSDIEISKEIGIKDLRRVEESLSKFGVTLKHIQSKLEEDRNQIISKRNLSSQRKRKQRHLEQMSRVTDKVSHATDNIREKEIILDNNHKQACDEELPLVIEKPKKQIPLWKTDFEVYYKDAKDSLITLLDDKNFISVRERYHDGLDIALTLEKSFNDYWGTNVGWDKKKKSKTDVINWERTYNNALTLKSNKVWKKINKEVFK